jgi:hypothetical protein
MSSAIIRSEMAFRGTEFDLPAEMSEIKAGEYLSMEAMI